MPRMAQEGLEQRKRRVTTLLGESREIERESHAKTINNLGIMVEWKNPGTSVRFRV